MKTELLLIDRSLPADLKRKWADWSDLVRALLLKAFVMMKTTML